MASAAYIFLPKRAHHKLIGFNEISKWGYQLDHELAARSDRAPASLTGARERASNTRPVLNDRVALPPRPKLPTLPPLVNPIQPSLPTRASSAQSNDPAWVNLFNIFSRQEINQPSVPTALCNDGTKPVYFIKKGFGAGTNRWVIWLEGGGGCGSDDPQNPMWCGSRKGTYLDSSKDATEIGANIAAQGILSKDAAVNPDFYSYNLVNVHYCSSDFWGGIGEQKSINKNTNEKWWFSGKTIVQALMLDLKQKFNFSNATNVILTGSSAGGAGVTINANEMRASVPNADVITIIDASHIFPFPRYAESLNDPNYKEDANWQLQAFRDAYSFLPMEGNSECVKYKKIPTCGINERCDPRLYECMLPAYAGRFIKMPVFVSSDQLDQSILDMYGFSFCTEQDPVKYTPWLNDYLAEQRAHADDIATGYFFPRTGDHGLTPTHHWVTPVEENGIPINLQSVFGAWYFNRNTPVKKFIQSKPVNKLPHEEVSHDGCKP